MTSKREQLNRAYRQIKGRSFWPGAVGAPALLLTALLSGLFPDNDMVPYFTTPLIAIFLLAWLYGLYGFIRSFKTKDLRCPDCGGDLRFSMFAFDMKPWNLSFPSELKFCPRCGASFDS